MTNDVNNTTEESNTQDASVTEETNMTETSAEMTAEAQTNETAQAQTEADAAEPQTAQTETETPPTAAPTETAATTAQAETADEQQSSEEPQPAAEMDFGAILEEFEQDQTVYHSGELVEGKVVGVSDRGVLIDFGYKSEGVVAIEEFQSPEGEVTVKSGDMVEVIIKSIGSGDAPPILSRSDALRRKSWDIIEKAYNDETPITGRVIEKTKGGLRVDIEGVEAFLPGSQVDSRPIRNLDSFKGQEIEAKVIKFSRKRNNIVLSRKVLTDEVVNKQKAETLNQIEEGYVVEGTVKNLTEYGAFVDLGGIDGLLHVTDMSWGRLQNPGEQFKVGENIQVKVLKLDREKEKVSLGYKQLIPDPWSTVIELYPVGSRIKGKISSVTDYGAFVELEPGVEGLVHISEMSWSKRTKHPKKMLRPGEEVEVQVLGIDTEDHRISLGMKQLQPNPWETITERFHVGDKVRGRVRNLTDFGAFVEIEDGVDGLVHVSDISWSKKIKHPKDVLKKDQEVEAVITSIDTDDHRMSLSIKELTPSAWESFVATHKAGDIVRGRVSRFAGFGVFVELGSDLEGLCHISELSDERVERPEDVVQIGQEMDFKILRIEHDVQKIGLSARAVGRAEEPSFDSKSYTTEAKGGMASLGELANLKFGRGGEEETAKEEPKLSKKERKAQKALERAAEEEASAEAETSESAVSDETEATADETPAAETTSEETAVEEPAAETAAEETAATEDTVSAETTSEAEESASTEAASETEEAAVAETTGEAEETAAAETASETESETASSDVEAATAETSEEETASTEAETTETAETEASTEETASAETEAETPQLTDTEGEASVAPDDTAPRDEEAVAEATGETEAESEKKSA